jgi:hypothetical protein
MAHEVAKLLLEHAGTFLERTEAVKSALSLGMPLDEIEAYFDWLDSIEAFDQEDENAGPNEPAP